MSKTKRGYDEKVGELAEYFMSDGEDVPAEAVADLAQCIQDAIEDWFVGWDPVLRRRAALAQPSQSIKEGK